MRGLGPPKSRRCHFFDRQGNSVRRGGEFGCPRTAPTCHFIHPSDPEWSKVPDDMSTGSLAYTDSRRSAGEVSPRHSTSSPTSYRGRERRRSPSVDHQRGSFESSRRTPPRGSSSSTYRRDRSPTSRPRSPWQDDSSPRRGSSFSVRSLPRRSTSNERPSSSSKRPLSYDRPHPPSKSVSKPPPPSTGAGNSSSGNRTSALPAGPLKDTAVPMPSGDAASTTPKPSSAISSTAPSAPAKLRSSQTFTEVLPPPPSIDPAPPEDGLTPEQRRALWEKRLALMADATQEYMDLGKLEKDVQSRRRQVQSAAFDTLPSDVKDAFRAGLKHAEANCQKKKASLNSAISKLSETNFWPSVPPQKVGDMEAKLKEAKTLLGGLADSVGQLYKRIESLYEERHGRSSTTGPSNTDDGARATGGSGEGDIRAKKRRRLSDGGIDVAATTSEDVREDIESIGDTIREIEDRLQEMENDMAQHSYNVLEQLEVHMDEKIEEIAQSADLAAAVEAQLGPHTAKTIEAFDESIAQADRDIADLAQEMADLISRLDVLQRDDDLSKQQDAADRESLAQLVKADQENAEALARLQEEAKTLRSALTAHAKLARPVEPVLPLSGSFMEAIKASVVTQVQEHIVPIVTQTRTEFERMTKTRDVELYEKLKDKLDQSHKMSQLLSTWIEHNPDDARQAFAAAAASRTQVGGASSSGSVLT